MMKRSPRLLLLFLCIGVGLAVTQRTETPSVLAQETGDASRLRGNQGIPPAAMLTDRGRELAESLKNLRRTRANLGPKHPTLPVIEQAISETEQQLRAWLPDERENENPFKNLDSPPPSPMQEKRPDPGHAEMNDNDLRQLVLRLHAKIESLEARVRVLERAQK